MKINHISTFILVCLLTSRIKNLLVIVRADHGATATTPAETVKKTPFELDIKKSSGTNEFVYKKDGNVVTFTAKDNYAFNIVKQSDKEIWKTEKETEFVTKVVLNGKGKKDKIVTIYFPDDTNKSYKKDKNNPWSEYTGNSTGGSPDTIPGSTNENASVVNIKKAIDTNYISEARGSILIYVPRAGYCFNEVKEDSMEIWKTDKKDEYSKKVLADFAKNVVTIHIGTDDNSKKVYKKESGTWKEDTNASTYKSTTDASGGGATPASPTSGGTTGTGASGGGAASTPATQ